MKYHQNQENAPNLIVGGGIIGLLIAWYLTESGERSVVLDRCQIGKESSWAGGGILSPIYPNQYASLESLVSRSLPEYVSLTKRLEELTGIDSKLLFSQLIVVDEEVPKADSAPRGTPVDSLAMAKLEPALTLPGSYACCYPTAQIRNPRLLAALRSALLARDVSIIEDCKVLRFGACAGRLTSVMTTKGAFNANRSIVSAGAWTGDLLAQTYLSLPIQPVKGQMIVLAAQPSLISNVIVHKHRYLIPRSDGRILIGSTVEHVGFHKETTSAARSELYAAATQLIPALKSYSIEHHWAGLRPGSPDDAPFIGEHPNIKGLFVCAGHYRNGFATGPASARLVVDMMLGRQPLVDPTPFRLDRPCPEWRM